MTATVFGNLPPAISITGDEILAADQNGTTVRITAGQIADLASQTTSPADLPPASVPLAGTELVTLFQNGVEVSTPVDNIVYGINPQTFGAVGDGITDDTAAIQAAINYALTQPTNNRTILLGNNVITNISMHSVTNGVITSVDYSPGLKFVGKSKSAANNVTATIKVTGTNSVGFDLTAVNNIEFEGLSIYGDPTSSPKSVLYMSRGLSVVNSDGHHFNDVTFSGFVTKALVYGYNQESDVYTNCNFNAQQGRNYYCSAINSLGVVSPFKQLLTFNSSTINGGVLPNSLKVGPTYTVTFNTGDVRNLTVTDAGNGYGNVVSWSPAISAAPTNCTTATATSNPFLSNIYHSFKDCQIGTYNNPGGGIDSVWFEGALSSTGPNYYIGYTGLIEFDKCFTGLSSPTSAVGSVFRFTDVFGGITITNHDDESCTGINGQTYFPTALVKFDSAYPATTAYHQVQHVKISQLQYTGYNGFNVVDANDATVLDFNIDLVNPAVAGGSVCNYVFKSLAGSTIKYNGSCESVSIKTNADTVKNRIINTYSYGDIDNQSVNGSLSVPSNFSLPWYDPNATDTSPISNMDSLLSSRYAFCNPNWDLSRLGVNYQVGQVVRCSNSVGTSFYGYISSSILVVTSVNSGQVLAGMVLSASGIQYDTYVSKQVTSAETNSRPNGKGTYYVSVSQTIGSSGSPILFANVPSANFANPSGWVCIGRCLSLGSTEHTVGFSGTAGSLAWTADGPRKMNWVSNDGSYTTVSVFKSDGTTPTVNNLSVGQAIFVAGLFTSIITAVDSVNKRITILSSYPSSSIPNGTVFDWTPPLFAPLGRISKKTTSPALFSIPILNNQDAGAISFDAQTVTDGKPLFWAGDKWVDARVASGLAGAIQLSGGNGITTSNPSFAFDGQWLGVGAPPTPWTSSYAYSGIQAISVALFTDTYYPGTDSGIAFNAYLQSDAWTYTNDGYMNIINASNGNFLFLTSHNATAGSSTTLANAFTIDNSGLISSARGLAPNDIGVTSVSTLNWSSYNRDCFDVTAQSGSLTIAVDINTTPINFKKITFRITAASTVGSLVFTSSGARSFRIVGLSGFPTSLATGQTLYVDCVYNQYLSTPSISTPRWDIVRFNLG